MHQQYVAVERTQDGFAGSASFFRRRIAGQTLPIHPLQQEVGGQGDHHQKDQRFHATRRLQKNGTYGQGAFELSIGVFAVILLLELREQQIDAGLRRGHGGHQGRVAVISFVLLYGSVVKLKEEAVRGQLAATSRRGQRLLLLLAQRHHLPS